MRETLYAEGGRPFYDDDLETIQHEARASVLAVLAGLGHDCIVSGCAVLATGATYTLSPGIVYVGGQLLRCLGASGVTLPAALVVGAISILDERTYQTGDTKTCIQEQFAEVAANAPGLQLYPAGGFTMAHALRSQVHELGDVKWGSLVGANYDATGLGLPGSPAWGWALCNGQPGRYDLRGAFVAGYDPDRTDYAAVGKVGGAESITLTVDQMPNHSHTSNNRITKENKGDAGSYTAALTGSFNADGKAMSSQTVGGSQAHENRPPFYVLAARQWVGF